ncbi:MAG: GrpB family protein [Actinomycetota bacterium]|nr:GrpB family protein [Actinomycetota bacterium]
MSETHPWWRPYDPPTPEEIAAARVAPAEVAPVEVVPPDPDWPERFESVRASIVEALGERALAVRHVGSTSVPGLWAKPIIDVDLTVADSGDETAYLTDLEAAGFVLRVREPDWEEHRMVRGAEPASNVHIFGPGAVESARQVALRDWLIAHSDDQERYAALKRDLAARGFTDVMLYNNAKAGLIYDIYERIFAADPDHPHTPRPR